MKRQNVQDSEFTLLFEPVMSGGGAVRLIDHSRNRESNVKVAVDLRKQALAASRVKDQTHYIVPHGTRPVGDIRLYIQHMLAQVSTLKGLLKYSENTTAQWESLTKRFPELDDIVDRTHEGEGLTSLEMRKCLIRLYQTYVSEWDTVEPQISGDFLNQVSNQQVSQDFQLAIQ
jgi:hypothetical protein